MGFVQHDPQDVTFSGGDIHDLEFEGSKVNLYPDADMRALTGIDPAGRASGGSEIVLYNASATHRVLLPHDAAGSTAGFRLLSADARDRILGPGQKIWALYNEAPGTTTGWIIEDRDENIIVLTFGAGSTSLSATTRYTQPGNSDNAASGSVLALGLVGSYRLLWLKYRCTTGGTTAVGAVLSVAAYTVDTSDVPTLALGTSTFAPSTRRQSAVGDIDLGTDPEIAVGITSDNTLTASPARMVVTLGLEVL